MNRGTLTLDGNTGGRALNVVLELALLNQGFSAMEVAYQMGHRSRGRTLTSGGTPQKEPPLCIAAHQGHRAVAELLLDAGANMEATDNVRGGWEGKVGEISSGAVRCTHGVVGYFQGCFCVGVKDPRIYDVGFSVHDSRFQ